MPKARWFSACQSLRAPQLAMRPARAREEGRGGGGRPPRGREMEDMRQGRGGGGPPGRAGRRGADGRPPRMPRQGPGGRGGPPIRQRYKKPPGLLSWYKPRVSHGFVAAFSFGLLLMLSLWTFPSYYAYANRPNVVKQYCLVHGGNNATGCVKVEIVHESICDPAVPELYGHLTTDNCTDLCVYSDEERTVGNTTAAQRDAFVDSFIVGAELPCFYPPGDSNFTQATFTVPYNPNEQMFLSLVWLSPFVFFLLVSVHCALRKPREALELEDDQMLTGLFNEVVVQRNHQEKFVSDVEMRVKSLKSAVDGEQQKRLDVVQEVEKERRDRLTNEDNLKHALHENMRSLESKLVREMAQRLAAIPIPSKLKDKMMRKADKYRDREDRDPLLGGGRGKNDRPDSAASLIFEDHQRNAERRRAALANDLDAQRGAFKQRLEERKSKGKRSKSKDPGAKRRD